MKEMLAPKAVHNTHWT